MTGLGDDAAPELPPPPLADHGRLAAQPARFPDAPLPWLVVLGGLVGGLAQGLLSIQGVYLVRKLCSSTMPVLTGLIAAAIVLTATAIGVVLALLFVVVDRRARGTGRPLRWALAGAVLGLGLALTLTVLGTSPGLWTVGRLTAAVSYIVYLLVRFALLGLVYGLFARWRHHAALVFAVAGAITSGLSLLLSPIMATLTSIPSGFPSLVGAVAAWQAAWTGARLAWLTITTTLAHGAVYGACFGAAIAVAERRRLARECRQAEAAR